MAKRSKKVSKIPPKITIQMLQGRHNEMSITSEQSIAENSHIQT